MWGILSVTPTGLELTYQDAVQDEKHIESSYLLFASEYGDIQAIYRYADELTEENKRSREKELKSWFHPGPLRWLGRSTRHFVGTASESLNEVMGIIVGRVRKPAGRYITDTGEAYLKRFGGDLIGQVGSEHDQLLERLIGHRVVAEIVEEGEVHEHVGIFKNYSADFFELLDVQYPDKKVIPVQSECCVITDKIIATASEGTLRIENHQDFPVLVHALFIDERELLMNVVVDSGEAVDLSVDQPCEKAELVVRVVRELDLIVPRTRASIRHRADRMDDQYLPDIIFDLGVVLRLGSREEAREGRLREALERNPNDALASANLAGVLLQQEKFTEAEQLLRLALDLQDSLPDRGRRARMQLRELERKRSEHTANPGVVIIQPLSQTSDASNPMSVPTPPEIQP